MKKISKVLAVLLAVSVLFSMAAMSAGANAMDVPNPNYKQPKVTANKITSRPNIDGVLDDAAWKQATEVVFTQKALADGAGHLFSYQTAGTWKELPSDGNGMAYIGWDEEYFYFALEVKDINHTNKELANKDLYKGDCLQIQIGPDMSDVFNENNRHELGFAVSTDGTTKGRRLGYRWYPAKDAANLLAGSTNDMASKATANYYYYVGRDEKNATTTYEVALQYDFFGRSAQMKQGDKLPFSFALHLYEDTPLEFMLDPNAFNGYFLEWAHGLVDGHEKTLSEAAVITLGAPSGGAVDNTTKPTTTTTTTRRPTTTTTTTKPGDDNKVTTKPVVTTKTPTTKPGDDNNVVATTTTTTTTIVTTTTTEAPEVAGVYNYNLEDASDVTDEAILSELATAFTDKELAVKAVVSTEEKIGNVLSENLLGVYVKDEDGKLVAVESITETAKDENGEDVEVIVYEVGKDATVYVVEEVIPTTTTIAPTTTTTTTTAKAADAVTTTAEEEPAGSLAWLWIVLGAVVVAGAAVVIVLVLKKKNGAEAPTEE